MIAAGPDYASPTSIWRTPLDVILPAEPSGDMTERSFHARLTDAGKRHPVTRALEGSDDEPPHWSHWFRLVNTKRTTGTSVMQGPDGKPLLVLAREGEGRVALLLSDHIWLWARGYEGGGPHLDLLRRLSHWLMKQPDLEEEALRLIVHGRDITVQRQTMADTVNQVTLTSPGGQSRTLNLTAVEPGLWRTQITANELGLWRATDGKLTALANVGPANPREFQEVTSIDRNAAHARRARPAATRAGWPTATGFNVPRVVPVRTSTTLQGRRLDRPEDARRQRRARHRRAADLCRPDRAVAAGRLAGRDLGAEKAAKLLMRLRRRYISGRSPVRPDQAVDAVEGAGLKFGHQQAGRIDRSRHFHLALGDALEAGLAVERLVADQHHQLVALRLGVLERARDQRRADAALAERRLDRQRPEQQRRRLADADRRQPQRADQQRADARGEGQIEHMAPALADAKGAAGIAAGAEGALMQPLDRQRRRPGSPAGWSGRVRVMGRRLAPFRRFRSIAGGADRRQALK